jgi:hypothetical protein
LTLGAGTWVQLAPPSAESQSFWPPLAWKNMEELPVHHGDAKA